MPTPKEIICYVTKIAIINHRVCAKTLQLGRHDVNVKNVRDTTEQVHGLKAQALKADCVFHVEEFDKPIKRNLKPREASNNTELPGKYDLIPKFDKGMRFLVFSLESEDNDEGALNYASDDSIDPSPPK